MLVYMPRCWRLPKPEHLLSTTFSLVLAVSKSVLSLPGPWNQNSYLMDYTLHNYLWVVAREVGDPRERTRVCQVDAVR